MIKPILPILLVEDWEDDIESLKLVFKRIHLANPVMVVRDGVGAIDYLQGKGLFSQRDRFPLPGVLLLDMKLPRLGGFEVLRWLEHRPQFNGLLKIVLSGQREVWEVNRAYKLGARSFLLKPCGEEDIMNLAKAWPEHWIFEAREEDRPEEDLAPIVQRTSL